MRRAWIYLLIAATVLGSVAWINHVPYRPDMLGRAVPADAVWVSRHQCVAERWSDLTGSWLTPLAAQMIGMPWLRVRAWLESRTTRAWIQQFGEREVWLCIFPDEHNGMALGACAWIGGRSWRWRWALARSRRDGIHAVGNHRGRTIWVWTPPDHDRDLRGSLALAVEEGVLLACWSDDPSAIVKLLDAYDGLTPRHVEARRLVQNAASDVAVVHLPWANQATGIQAEWESARGRVRGRLLLRSARLPDGKFAGLPSELPNGVRWILARAVAYAWVAPEWVLSEVPLPWRQRLGEVLERVHAVSEPPWLIALHDAPLDGRLRGLRVPGLTVSMRLRGGVNWSNEVASLLDRINSREPWGCVGAPLPGVPGVVALEFTRQGLWRGAPLSECIAWAEDGGWVTLVNSAQVLQMLKFAGPAPAVAEPGTPSAPIHARFVIHVPRAVEAVRLALDVVGLLRLIADPVGSAEVRFQYERWREMLTPWTVMSGLRGDLVRVDEGVLVYFEAFADSAEFPAACLEK